MQMYHQFKPKYRDRIVSVFQEIIFYLLQTKYKSKKNFLMFFFPSWFHNNKKKQNKLTERMRMDLL